MKISLEITDHAEDYSRFLKALIDSVEIFEEEATITLGAGEYTIKRPLKFSSRIKLKFDELEQ